MVTANPIPELAGLMRSIKMRFLLLVSVVCVVLLAVVVISGRHETATDVFTLSNYLGPVTQGLHDTGRMVFFRSGAPYIGVVPFYAARMPFAIYFLLVMNKVFAGHFFLLQVGKTFLLALPLLLAAWLALRATGKGQLNLVTAILLTPFVIPSFLLLATSMQVEEAFFYSFLALALSLLIYARNCPMPQWLLTIVYAVVVDLVYLTESSMRVTCFVLVVAMLFQLRNLRLSVLLCLLTVIAPLGWGGYLYRTTGHFTVNSSLDGFNFHKGNYPEFLDRYPPADNGYMDKWDPTITPQTPMFHSEWEDSAWHMRQGVLFLHQPGNFALATIKKFDVYFLTLRDIGSGHHHDIFTRFDIVNMLLFRLLTLGAIVGSMVLFLRGRERLVSLSFLFFVAASAAPFVAGFALTRHAAILIEPSAIVLAYYASQGAFSRRLRQAA